MLVNDVRCDTRIMKKIRSKIDLSSRWKIAAGVVKNGIIIGAGHCSYKSHPLQKEFAKNEHAIFLHAEIEAIKNALKHDNRHGWGVDSLEGCSIYICRLKFSDDTRKTLISGISKPCIGCMRALVTFGIKEIFFTLDQ